MWCSYTFLLNFCNSGSVSYPTGFEDPENECPTGVTGNCEAIKDGTTGQPSSVRGAIRVVCCVAWTRGRWGEGLGTSSVLRCQLDANCIATAGVRELRVAARGVVDGG